MSKHVGEREKNCISNILVIDGTKFLQEKKTHNEN